MGKAAGNWLCASGYVHRTRNDRFQCNKRLIGVLSKALCSCGELGAFAEDHAEHCRYRMVMEQFHAQHQKAEQPRCAVCGTSAHHTDKDGNIVYHTSGAVV